MSAGLSQQFCVRWNSHLGSLGAAFPQLLAGQRFVDVTLACEGHQVHCHRLVLAACSTYFEHLLGENPCQHPIIILPRDIKLWAMQALVDFMYKGEVNVSQAGLPDLMKCAEILKIRGLCGSDAALNLNQIHSPPVTSTASFQQQQQQHHLPATDAGTDATTMTSTKDTRTSNNKQSHSQFQNRSEPHHNTRASQQSSGGGAGHRGGPKGQLLSSLHLQPVIGARSQLLQDDCNISDNGESSNEMCIKTEDLIDDDTSSKPCEDEEELEMDPGEKIPSAFALANVTCEYDTNSHQQSPPAVDPSATGGRRIRRSEELLRQAAEYVSGGETFQNVSIKFKIPISTIRFYMARKGILPRRKRGRTAMLPYGTQQHQSQTVPNSASATANTQRSGISEQQFQQQLRENMALAAGVQSIENTDNFTAEEGQPAAPPPSYRGSRSPSPSGPPFHFANYKLPELRPNLM